MAAAVGGRGRVDLAVPVDLVAVGRPADRVGLVAAGRLAVRVDLAVVGLRADLVDLVAVGRRVDLVVRADQVVPL